MKKIGKLTINPEKVIKNEELVNLRGGGYGGGGGNVIIDCNGSANPPYADPQPCAWYPDGAALAAAVIKYCVSGATISDC